MGRRRSSFVSFALVVFPQLLSFSVVFRRFSSFSCFFSFLLFFLFVWLCLVVRGDG
nr:MAG TPA: hypothetical protein [Caudoviricetes sp.]